MAESVVLLLEPRSSGASLIAAAERLGLSTHVIDRKPLARQPSRVRAAVASRRMGFTQADTSSADAMIRVATELTAHADVVAAVPASGPAVPAAASVTAALGLRGTGPETAHRLRGKDLLKRVLAGAGVGVAPGALITPRPGPAGVDALAEAAATIGYPLVVKSADGAGGPVRRVDDLATLRRVVADRPGGRCVLLERHVAGRPVRVVGYLAGGRPAVAAVIEVRLADRPHLVEVGYEVDATFPPADRAALERTSAAALAALGLSRGVFGLEARLTPAGPVVIDVSAELPDERLLRLVTAVHGVDLAETLLRCLTARPVPAITFPVTPLAAVRCFTVRRPSRLTDPARLREQIVRVDGYQELRVTVDTEQPEPALLEPGQRFGHATVHAADRRALSAALAHIDAVVDKVTTPEP